MAEDLLHFDVKNYHRKDLHMRKLLLTALIFGSLIGIANYTLMASANSQSKPAKSGLIGRYEGTIRNKFYKVKKEFKVNLRFYNQQDASVIKKSVVLPKGTVIVSRGETYYKNYVVDNDFNINSLRYELQNDVFDTSTHPNRVRFDSQIPASKVTLINRGSQSLSHDNQLFSNNQLKNKPTGFQK